MPKHRYWLWLLLAPVLVISCHPWRHQGIADDFTVITYGMDWFDDWEVVQLRAVDGHVYHVLTRPIDSTAETEDATAYNEIVEGAEYHLVLKKLEHPPDLKYASFFFRPDTVYIADAMFYANGRIVVNVYSCDQIRGSYIKVR